MYNYSPVSPNSQTKILSVGMQSYQPKPSPRRTNPEKAGGDRNRQLEYRAQLDADKEFGDKREHQSRKVFVRKEVDNDGGTGFTIGSQMTQQEQADSRRRTQDTYRAKLKEDMMIKTMIKSDEDPQPRRSIVRRTTSDDYDSSTGFNIGTDESAMLEKKRTQARQIMELSRMDALQKEIMMKDTEVRVARVRRTSMPADNDGSQYTFAIGADPAAAKYHEKESRKVYMAQLDADTGKFRKPEKNYGRGGSGGKEYVDYTGLTGFNIGGSEQTNPQQKQWRQAQYRELLDQQRQDARFLSDADGRDYVDPTAPVPYMQY